MARINTSHSLMWKSALVFRGVFPGRLLSYLDAAASSKHASSTNVVFIRGDGPQVQSRESTRRETKTLEIVIRRNKIYMR